MSSSEYAKVDTGLMLALHAYEENPEKRPEDGITVSMRFEGDLQSIVALGFESHVVMGDEAFGIVRFKDVRALMAQPGVLRIVAGRPSKPTLNTAAEDILARAPTLTGGTPDGGLWHVDPKDATGKITALADATGKGVVVAVIDTGIDYKHPMFMSQLTPEKKTRILRIWDQGMIPTTMAECPTIPLFLPGKTYGVEYKDTDINKELNDVKPRREVKHRDCDGHGTHVAGIAAGGPLFPAGGDASKVGVAPEASIIAVKILDIPEQIFYRVAPAATRGDAVEWPFQFKDAVLYCLRQAQSPEINKPIVINLSLGDASLPGDGLDPDALFIDQIMDPTKAAGPLNFPSGAVIVKAAGNDGDKKEARTAHITVPASVADPTVGEIIVPFKLTDNRAGHNETWKECGNNTHKPPIGVHFWYRRTPVPLAVQFALRLPADTVFGSDVAVGATHRIGFRPVGPPPRVLGAPVSSSQYVVTVKHEDPLAVAHPDGGTAHRHYVHFFVEPKVIGKTVSYHPGIYEIRIKAPIGTRIFAMCDEDYWGKLNVTFSISDKKLDDNPRDAINIEVTEKSSAVDTLGRHAITVAASDDILLNFIADFSSRGPLRNFSDKTVLALKPDITAPGVDIMSAEGIDTEDTKSPLFPRWPPWKRGIRFTEHSGTSMAAPMIAGVIALMLDKKPTLTIPDVRKALSAPNVRPATHPSTNPAATEAYGQGVVDAKKSHTSI